MDSDLHSFVLHIFTIAVACPFHKSGSYVGTTSAYTIGMTPSCIHETCTAAM